MRTKLSGKIVKSAAVVVVGIGLVIATGLSGVVSASGMHGSSGKSSGMNQQIVDPDVIITDLQTRVDALSSHVKEAGDSAKYAKEALKLSSELLKRAGVLVESDAPPMEIRDLVNSASRLKVMAEEMIMSASNGEKRLEMRIDRMKNGLTMRKMRADLENDADESELLELALDELKKAEKAFSRGDTEACEIYLQMTETIAAGPDGGRHRMGRGGMGAGMMGGGCVGMQTPGGGMGRMRRMP